MAQHASEAHRSTDASGCYQQEQPGINAGTAGWFDGRNGVLNGKFALR